MQDSSFANVILAPKCHADLLDKTFHLTASRTTIRTEVLAGLTTFMTMSYIIFVQPAVLSTTGMDFGAVLAATCIVSAIGCFLMAFLANYPIAVAPAMGHNFFFAFTVVAGMDYSWQVALGAVFISGIVFLLMSIWGVREALVQAIPDSLKRGIAVGIGLLITLVGLEWSGFLAANPATLVTLGDLHHPAVWMSGAGILVTSALLVRRVARRDPRGHSDQHGSGPRLRNRPLPRIRQRSAVDCADCVQAGRCRSAEARRGSRDLHVLLSGSLRQHRLADRHRRAGRLHARRANCRALAKRCWRTPSEHRLSGLLGNSPVVSYIESAAGVAEGGKTGLANIVTGLLMLAGLFFAPLAQMIGEGYKNPAGLTLYPTVAPALIVVGAFMMRNVGRIEWDDPLEYIPAFITIAFIPFTFSITDGIAFGFISYVLLSVISGRYRKLHWLMVLFTALFVIRYAAM